jgi:4-amino-4-deoxy-L-arabinose transferase-like glycosyltransferase
VAGFLLGWLLGPLAVLECARTKLIHYYLPAFPAAALLVGWLVVRVADDRVRAWLRDWRFGRLARGTFVVVGLLTTSAMAAGAYLLPADLRWPLLVLAALAAVTAAVALGELTVGRAGRAVRGMIGLSALTAATATGWLLPAAEPYRLSAVVGRRLAALEAREGAPPVLCSFQTSGTVFALGHPAAIIRSKAMLVVAVARAGKVLTALRPDELAVYGDEPGLAVEVRETLEGFNLEKARRETLHLAVIRSDGLPLADRTAPAVRR